MLALNVNEEPVTGPAPRTPPAAGRPAPRPSRVSDVLAQHPELVPTQAGDGVLRPDDPSKRWAATVSSWSPAA
jgi:hypothetical protein